MTESQLPPIDQGSIPCSGDESCESPDPAIERPAMIANGDAPLVLPADTPLEEIRAVGPDLHIKLADGSVIVIPNGALDLPEIVIGNVRVPPANIAALLVGREPEPAAGALQSSGGNFVVDPGSIGPAFDLGDLLPPTDFAFTSEVDDDFLIDRLDNKVSVTIVTPEAPAGAIDATALVAESGLGPRGSEPPGSDSAADSESFAGKILIDARDGPATVAINGVGVTEVGQEIATSLGVLKITAISPSEIAYTYTLTDNVLGPEPFDEITVVVTDSDGDVGVATVTISVADDAPTARNDSLDVEPATYIPYTGNLVTGAGTTSGSSGADTKGADGASVTGVRAGAGPVIVPGTAVQGQFGTLVVQPDGAFTYTRGSGTPGGVEDVFSYQLTDGDGDVSSAIVTFRIADSGAVILSVPDGEGSVVNEAGLAARGDEPAGSDEAADSEMTGGTITFSAPDGPPMVEINGERIVAVGQQLETEHGVLTITAIADGAIGYSYTLLDNVGGDAATEELSVVITDLDGDSDFTSIIIQILDDAPVAEDDAAQIAAGGFGPVSGNVITDSEGDGGKDTLGADGGQVTRVTGPSGTATAGNALQGLYGTLTIGADGAYVYERDPGTPGGVADVFSYTLTDGDGDEASATLTVEIGDSSVVVLSVPDDGSSVVSEAGLGARGDEPPGSDERADSETTRGRITFAAPDGPAIVEINGEAIVEVGQQLQTANGVLTITAIADGAIEYSYDLSDNVTGDAATEQLSVVVTDLDGDSDSALVTIRILDDRPTAKDDAAELGAGEFDPISGNVITDGPGADTLGADGGRVARVAGAGGTAGAGTALEGRYGVLTIEADGSYVYERNPGSAGGVSDVFTYTLVDGDGDEASATLTVRIADAPVSLELPEGEDDGLRVSEAGLPQGSDAGSGVHITQGTIAFEAGDAPADLTIAGIEVIAVGQTIAGRFGTLTVTGLSDGQIDYQYELTSRTDGDFASEEFAVAIADRDGDRASGTLRIAIADDAPFASDDSDQLAGRDGAVADGNVMTGQGGTDANDSDGTADVPGADGAKVSAITFNGQAGVVGGTTAGAFGTLRIESDGSYRYSLAEGNPLVAGLNGDETLDERFTYNLVDGDGDSASATLTIAIRGIDDGITLTGLDAEGPEARLAEANLSEGSSPDASRLVASGRLEISAVDGLAEVTLGGVTLFDGEVIPGLSIDTGHGLLEVTGVTTTRDAGGDVIGLVIDYRYTLVDASPEHVGPDDASLLDRFAIVALDTDGTTLEDMLEIQVRDDTPTARGDGAALGEGAGIAVEATSGVLANDTPGADDSEIAGVYALNGEATPPADGGVGQPIAGMYGVLTLNADGSYKYQSTPDVVPVGGAVDRFVYTLRDGDGDLSTAILTITLGDSGLVAASQLAQVSEAALAFGSDPESDAEIAEGTVATQVAGGTGPYTFELVGSGTGARGTLVLDEDGTFTYTLTSAVRGPAADNGADLVQSVETFTYRVIDANGNTATAALRIDVVDDVPKARPDPAVIVVEDAAPIGGNLLANDTRGADGATLATVVIDGVTVAIQPAGTTTHTNGKGNYTFRADGAWSFDPAVQTSAPLVNADFTYTIRDGDGDLSTSSQAISIRDGAGPAAGASITLTVDDQRLEDGSTPAPAPPEAATGTIVFTPGSDPIASIAFGSVDTLDGGLTWQRLSATEIRGFDGDRLVVTLTLSVSGNTASVTVTLVDNFAAHPDTSEDDIADLGTIGVVATDTDGDSVSGEVSIAVSDDVPTIAVIGAPAGLLVVDETDLGTNASADFAALFDARFHADGPGTVTYAFQLGNVTGLVDVATGQGVGIRFGPGGSVVGFVLGAPHLVVFTLAVDPAGVVTLDQLRAVRHADASNPDETAGVFSSAIRLVATIADADGDEASATLEIGSALVFRDDGPRLDAAAIDTGAIVLTTRDGFTVGAASDTASASFAAAFTLPLASFGADGAGGIAWVYSLALGANAGSTGLTSNGVAVTLTLEGKVVVGRAGGVPVFSIAVDAAGLVTLTQFAEIDHPLPGSSSAYADQLVTLAENLVVLSATATVTDRDGDSVSETVTLDLGGNIRFADAGPSVGTAGTAPALTVDESDFATNAEASFAGIFAGTLDYGPDGAGSVAYTLGSAGGSTGLVDSLTGEAVEVSLAGAAVVGRTATGGLEVFRITVDADGKVTLDQSRALIHSPDAGPDQPLSLVGANRVTLTATVTDGDGDTATATADITSRLVFRDDAPIGRPDSDSVAREANLVADGNVLTGTGGSDTNNTDGKADVAGADGGLVVTGVAFGATAGTLGAPLAGAHGRLVLEASGANRYELRADDPAVIALDEGEILTETFTYTIRDLDGDTATTSLTITITGANDMPVAFADTNWVADGPSGSDPSASGNVLLNVPHPGAPAGVFADVADVDPDSEPLTVVSAGTFTGSYGTLTIAADGSYTYRLNEDHPAVEALPAGAQLTEVFSYSVSDGSLATDSTLTVTIFGTNGAPVVGSAATRVSEEGLPAGRADSLPDAVRDTTDAAQATGTLAVSDPDTGTTLAVTLGDPGAVLASGGLPVTWSGVGTATLVGSTTAGEVIRITIDNAGNYAVNLSRPVDHAGAGVEDVRSFTVPVSVSDGTVTTTSASALTIGIEDDAPVAVGESGSSTQPQQNVNALFILDFSDSIDASELDTMISAVNAALIELDAATIDTLKIKFVIFSSGSFASPEFTSAADATNYLTSLNPADGGTRPDTIGLNTNYTGAIETALASWSVVPGSLNQVFFISDGNPNQQVQFGGSPPTVVNSLRATTATAWNTFVDSNDVRVMAIGIDADPLQPINIQRLADVDVNSAPDNQPILIDDFDDLIDTLLGVVVPPSFGGDLDANDFFGADGGRILSITVGAVTYTWDGATSIAVSTGGTISGTAIAAPTPMGGVLNLDFATGAYNYVPPSPIAVTGTENFAYVLVDRDGDTAGATLSVSLQISSPPVVLDLDGDGLEFVSAAAGARFDYDGDGVAETTAWVGRDDGILVHDADGDRAVGSASEIVLAAPGQTDLQGLAARFDGNRDGVLDARDAEFARFGVWQDADRDGVSEAGEFRSLGELGIVSIGLTGSGRSYRAADGQVIVHSEASYTRSDGTRGKVGDVSFATHVQLAERTMPAAVLAGAVAAAALIPAIEPAAAAAPGVHEQRPSIPRIDDTLPASATDALPRFVSSGDFAPEAMTRFIDSIPVTRELVGPDDAEAHLPELADVLAFAVTRHQELDFSALASAPEGAGQPAFASTWAGGPDGTGPSPGLASEIVIEAISGADPREVPVERLVAMLTGPEPGAIGDATDAVRLPDRPIGGDLSPENAAAGAYEGIGHGSDILFAMIADHHLAAQLEAATVGHA